MKLSIKIKIDRFVLTFKNIIFIFIVLKMLALIHCSMSCRCAFDNLVKCKKKTGCTISFVQEYSVRNFTSTEVEISILFLLSALISKLVQQALNLFTSVGIKDSTQTAGYDKETT